VNTPPRSDSTAATAARAASSTCRTKSPGAGDSGSGSGRRRHRAAESPRRVVQGPGPYRVPCAAPSGRPGGEPRPRTPAPAFEFGRRADRARPPGSGASRLERGVRRGRTAERSRGEAILATIRATPASPAAATRCAVPSVRQPGGGLKTPQWIRASAVNWVHHHIEPGGQHGRAHRRLSSASATTTPSGPVGPPWYGSRTSAGTGGRERQRASARRPPRWPRRAAHRAALPDPQRGFATTVRPPDQQPAGRIAVPQARGGAVAGELDPESFRQPAWVGARAVVAVQKAAKSDAQTSPHGACVR